MNVNMIMVMNNDKNTNMIIILNMNGYSWMEKNHGHKISMRMPLKGKQIKLMTIIKNGYGLILWMCMALLSKCIVHRENAWMYYVMSMLWEINVNFAFFWLGVLTFRNVVTA